MTVFLLCVAVMICAAGWLVNWVGTAALSKYIIDKGYTPPSDEEIKACSVYVWKKLMGRE